MSTDPGQDGGGSEQLQSKLQNQLHFFVLGQNGFRQTVPDNECPSGERELVGVA